LNYDNQYSFGGDILVYYKIKQPEPVNDDYNSTSEAELKDLLISTTESKRYHPATEIQKAINMTSAVSKEAPQMDDKTEALMSSVKECKSALQRYDDLMNEFEGHQATQMQFLQQKVADEQKCNNNNKESQQIFESFGDQESDDDDDEDPVVMQDWTKRIEEEMKMKMC